MFMNCGVAASVDRFSTSTTAAHAAAFTTCGLRTTQRRRTPSAGSATRAIGRAPHERPGSVPGVQRMRAADRAGRPRRHRHPRRVGGAGLPDLRRHWPSPPEGSLVTAPISVPVLSGRPGPTRTSTYRSGHCGIGKHDACLGVYAGTDCTCWCHTAVTVRVWGTFLWRCETCGANGAAHETEASAHAAANLHLDRHGAAP